MGIVSKIVSAFRSHSDHEGGKPVAPPCSRYGVVGAANLVARPLSETESIAQNAEDAETRSKEK